MRYYLSVEQTDLRERRKRWAQKKAGLFSPEVRRLGTCQRPTDPPGGLIALINEKGHCERAIDMWGVEGISAVSDGILAACPWAIKKTDRDLGNVQDVFTAPQCSYLHTIRPKGPNLLITSTGADVVLELTTDYQITWEWWAKDHLVSTRPDFNGSIIDDLHEFRGIKIDTNLQLAHLNSAVWMQGHVLVTLFHQGSIISINPISGQIITLLDGLIRPHALRVVNDQLVTVADTGAGRALLIEIAAHPKISIIEELSVPTKWLQDAHYVKGSWVAVDGAASSVIHFGKQQEVIREDRFDNNWRLFEILPIL